MSNSIVTNTGLAAFAAAAANHTTLSVNRMVFAFRANLDVEEPPGADFAIDSSEIVHTATEVSSALLSANSVVYSTVLGPAVGDFHFNIVGLFADDTLIAVALQPVQYKIATSGFNLGNTLIKNFALEINRAGELTGVTIAGDPAAVGIAIALAQAAAEVAQAAAETAKNSFAGKKFFEIFSTMSTETPDGALPLDGRTLSGCDAEDSPYHAFYLEALRRKTAGTIPVLSAAQYAAILAEYGQCGSFVVGDGSIRLPKITAFLQAGTPGTVHAAGLPNIKGALPELARTSGTAAATGAFRFGAATGKFDDYESEGNHPVYAATFDASLFHSAYGKADTVQPESTEVRYYIQYTESGRIAGGGGSGGGVTPSEVLDIVAQSGGYLSSSGGYIATASSGGTVAIQVFSGGGYTYTALRATRSATYTVTDSGFTLLAGSSGRDGWHTSAAFQASDSAFIVNDVGNGNRALLTLSGLHRAALVESNGQSGRSAEVVASSNGAALYFDDGVNTAFVSAHSGGITINYYDMNAMESQTLTLSSGGAYLNGVPLGMATVSDTVTTSAAIPVLSGGTSYVYAQPLTSLSVASVANAPAEDYIRFTLASGGSVSIPASVAALNSGLEFEGGKEYLVAFNGGMMVAAEVTPGA